MTINKEKKETWIIPGNNSLDVNYFIKEEKKLETIDDIKNKSYIKSDLDKLKKSKNSVLFKKLNLNLNINRTNTFTDPYSLNNIKNLSSEGNTNQQKAITKHYKNNSNKIKLKNFFTNFKNSNSNNSATIQNLKNKDNIQSYKNASRSKNENFKSCFYRNDNNDIDDQSYAFQNLVNLNKDKSLNEKISRDGISLNEIKINKKKKLEKSPDKEKFFSRDSKHYFNDDKQVTDNIDLRKISDFNETKLKLDEPVIKKIEHKSIKFGQSRKNKECSEYDGDKDSFTLRKSNNKIPNLIDKNENRKSIKEKNRNDTQKIIKINDNRKNIRNGSFTYREKNDKKEKIEIVEPKRTKNEKNKTNNYKTFCDGFFISGIKKPLKEKIIKNSSDFLSSCGHKICSSLYSIQPEILYFYKNERINLSEDKLKNLSQITFPLGVKLCLLNKSEPKNIRSIPQQIFFNIIEDDNGEKLYLCTCYCYIKTDFNGFKQKFECDISIFYSDLFQKNNNKKDINNNMFYIPESITLISKYPFLNSMAICLHGFLSPFPEDRINLLNHIINEVPIPDENNQIRFFILLFSTPIILNHKLLLYKIMAITNKEKQKFLLDNNYLLTEELNFKKLYKSISLEHIIFIFNMILLEQKILLLYKDYETLSNIIFIFISILFPFSWKNKIFPIISLDMVETLKNQNQFIAGMDESLFAYINKHNIKIGNDIIIYNISLNSFISNKSMKKTNRKDLLYEHKLPNLPDKVLNFLLKELKNILKEVNANLALYNLTNNEESIEKYYELRYFKQQIEFETKLCFIKSIIILIGDFMDYTFFTEEKPLFNKEAFIDAHKEKDFKNFLIAFVNTNLFRDFLEDQKILFFSRAKNLNDEINVENNIYIRNNINSEVYYFNKISENFQELKNNNHIMSTALNLSNIIKGDIKVKADNICNNLILIDNTLNESINNNIKEINPKNEVQSEDNQYQINKKKTNVLFSGKNYLEDKNEQDKTKSKISNLKSKSKNQDLYFSHGLKDSKLSTENSTQNTYFKVIKKSDISPDKSKGNNKLLFIDMNSQNKMFINNAERKNRLNESVLKKYLLSPYFLSIKFDDDFYIKELKDEQTILKEIKLYKTKKGINPKFPPCTNMLYRNLRPIENNNYLFKKDKIYTIKNDNDDNIKNKNNYKEKNKYKFKKELNSFKDIYYKKQNNEKEIMNLKDLMQNDDKIILINKLFQICFEQKIELKNELLSSMKKIFLNSENSEYFINLIIPDNLLMSKVYHKQLSIPSFNFFSKIIKICFESVNIADKNLGRLLTLACFIYYKLEKDKIIYLYSEFLFNKLDKTQQPFKLWINESFWIEFFNLEFEFNNKNIEFETNDMEFSFNEINKDDIKYNFDINKKKKMCLIKTVITLCTIMLKLNIKKIFVINIVEKMILPVFVNDFYFINEIMNLALLANKTNLN